MNKNKLEKYIDSLIHTDGKWTDDGLSLHFEDIDEVDIDFICAILIEQSDHQDYLINENVESALIRHLRGQGCNNYDLSEVIRKSTYEYYEDTIRKVLSERLEIVEEDSMGEYGFYKTLDRQNNEIYWRE
jgi:hypothetical protein